MLVLGCACEGPFPQHPLNRAGAQSSRGLQPGWMCADHQLMDVGVIFFVVGAHMAASSKGRQPANKIALGMLGLGAVMMLLDVF